MDKIQQSHQSNSHSRTDRVERAPEKRDRDQLDEQGQKFSDKLGGKKEKQGEGNLPSPEALLAKSGKQDSAGDAILSQMFGGQQVKQEGPVVPMQTSKIEASSPVQNISRVAEVIADRILVSDSQFTDQKMISIKVKDDILPQTEIRVLAGENGSLKIEVKTGNADAFNFLNNQKDGLVKHLQNNLSENEIEVSVDMEGADDGQSDGRSRNQRDLYEEMQERDA